MAPKVSALDDVRVLELAGFAVQYVGKLLGDMGADVIKIEPPGGNGCRTIGPFVDDLPDINKSLFFWHYNTSKRGVTLNLEHPQGRKLLIQLVQKADVLIEGNRPGYLHSLGLDYPTLERFNPALVMLSLTPFGQTGPWKDWEASDLVHLALGGQMASSGYDDPTASPIAGTGYQSVHIGGNFACIAVQIGLLQRDASGKGQYIDCSVHEACAACTEMALPSWIYNKAVLLRQTGRHAFAVRDSPTNFKASDGIYVNTVIPAINNTQWLALVDWMDADAVADDLHDERFLDPFHRRQNWPRVAAAIGRFVALHPAEWLYRGAQQRKLPWGPIRAPEENLADPALQAREFWASVDHQAIGRSVLYPGAPYKCPEMPWRISTRAPLLGEHNFEVYGRELGLSPTEMTSLAESGAI